MFDMIHFCTSTRNPIARAGIIRKLMAKGYKLAGNYTVSDYFSRWPASAWPIVFITKEGYSNKLCIDLCPTIGNLPEPYSLISPAKIDEIPDCGQMPEPVPVPVFPTAAKYNMTYVKADGSEQNYTISNPIEDSPDWIKAYAFGRGVRTFVKSRVRSFSKVC